MIHSDLNLNGGPSAEIVEVIDSGSNEYADQYKFFEFISTKYNGDPSIFRGETELRYGTCRYNNQLYIWTDSDFEDWCENSASMYYYGHGEKGFYDESTSALYAMSLMYIHQFFYADSNLSGIIKPFIQLMEFYFTNHTTFQYLVDEHELMNWDAISSHPFLSKDELLEQIEEESLDRYEYIDEEQVFMLEVFV